MTYKQALDSGYKRGALTLYKGYVSRKVDIDDQPVKVAKGSRKGQLYVDLPSCYNTMYAYRQYLVAPDKI